jgi:hypothetical protein
MVCNPHRNLWGEAIVCFILKKINIHLKKNLQKLMGGSDCPFKSSTVIEAGEFSYL